MEEVNETGMVTASYVASPCNGSTRVDIIVRSPSQFVIAVVISILLLTVSQKPKQEDSIWLKLLGVFLPAGYPHSVTKVGDPRSIPPHLDTELRSAAHTISSSLQAFLVARVALYSKAYSETSNRTTCSMYSTQQSHLW